MQDASASLEALPPKSSATQAIGLGDELQMQRRPLSEATALELRVTDLASSQLIVR